MSSRRRSLHTCGVSFLIIAHTTCSRVQNLDGRLGSTARKTVQRAKLLNPLIFFMQYLCLLFLSFTDDCLLAIANIMERNFPPFKPVFDKIDDLLHLIQTFPQNFDDAVEKLACFNQVLFLEWAVTHAISLLNSMISLLMNWGRDDTRVKEILVDVNYNKGRNGSESAHNSEYCSKETISSMSETQAAKDKNIKSDAMKRTYMEVLKLGTKGEEVDEDRKENEKGNCKRSLEEGARDQAREDKEEFENDKKGSSKTVKDTKSCEKGDKNNESQKDKIEESVQKAEGNEQNYEGILSNEENSKVKEYDAMKGTCKEVLKMGTQGEEDDDGCKENENGAYKRSLVEGTRDRAMEDKEESENDKKGSTKEDTYYECITNNEEKSESESESESEYEYEYEEEESNGSIENEENIFGIIGNNFWLMKPNRKRERSSVTYVVCINELL